MLNTDTSITNIAKQVGIARKTLYAYWQEWQETEEATQINRKWHRLCKALEEENMEKAFDGLTKIKVRMTTEKHELTENINETVTKTYNLNYSEEDKNAVLDAYQRIRNRKRSSTNQPSSLH